LGESGGSLCGSTEWIPTSTRCAPQVFGQGKIPRIVAFDCGIKYNIIRYLVKYQNVQLTVVPFDYDLKVRAGAAGGMGGKRPAPDGSVGSVACRPIPAMWSMKASSSRTAQAIRPSEFQARHPLPCNDGAAGR
jgi:hypothetical protein